MNATSGSSDPFDYHLEKCGVKSFKTLKHREIHTFYPHNEEDEEDGDHDLTEEDVEDEDLIETNYTNGNKEVVKILIKSVLYVMKEVVCMLLDNVVNSVFVCNVFKLGVLLLF